MTTDPSTIVDAIVADLVANAGLPTVTTHKYSEPVVVMPADIPLLAVWAEDISYQLIVTTPGPAGQYARVHSVGIAWYTLAVGAAETGGKTDPTIVQGLNTVRELIVTRLATYCNGVPTFGTRLLGTIRSSSTKPSEGMVWRARVDLDVEEDA